MTDFRGVVVPGVPPLPPDLTLLDAAIRPEATSDPSSSRPESAQVAALPQALREELAKRQGDAWVRGITWAPEHHREAIVRDPCDNTTVIPRGSNLGIRTAVPYLILADDACSTFGFEERDYRGRAKRLVEAAKHKAVEKEFWTGELATAAGWPNDFLTNPETVEDITPGGGPPSILRGLQLLQDALAGCGFGGKGMIHLQRQTATNLITVIESDPHFTSKDGVMYDMFGNIVVPGVGYPGTGPENAEPAAGSAWIYATDMVAVREEDEPTIFPESFAEATNWGQEAAAAEGEEEPPNEANTIRFQAQKFAIAYFDGACHFACRVKLAE